MNKLLKVILNHKKTVVIAFLTLTAVCMFASTLVKVNYNVLDYLPDEAPSTTALDVMNEEYTKKVPNARLMLKNVSISEVLEIKNKIKEVDGVDEVIWLDDSINIYQPLEFADKKTIEEYYIDNNALISLTVDSKKQEDALREVKKIAGDDCAMSGTAVNIATAIELTNKEVRSIMVFVVLLVFGILLLTTTSWFEPVLFLVTIGIAIIINRGTNLFLGEISFISNAAGSVLQLAVSMDYSIFIVHRFAECRKEYSDPTEAMAMAVKSSFSSVMSSGLTTIMGFAALILMRFKIGPDMGIIMAKAIIISLFTVIMFLPSATLMSYRLIDKTKHKLLMPSFEKFGLIVAKWKTPILIIFIIITIPSFLAQQNNSFIYGASGIYGEGTKLGDDTELIENTFGKSNLMVLMVPNGKLSTERELSSELLSEEKITSVISYSETVGVTIPTDFVPRDILSQLISKNYSRMVLTVDISTEGKEPFEMVEKIRDIAYKYYGDSYLLLGETVNTYDMKDVVSNDNERVNIIAIVSIGLILLFNFKSISIPLILLLVIESSVWMNLAVPYFIDEKLFFIGYLIISSIQLGATVDYAILYADRYIVNRASLKAKDAAKQALTDTSLSILTSAIILTSAGLLLGFISTNGIISQLGILVGRGAILSSVMVLFVLPSLVILFDKIMCKTTLNLNFYEENSNEER